MIKPRGWLALSIFFALSFLPTIQTAYSFKQFKGYVQRWIGKAATYAGEASRSHIGLNSGKYGCIGAALALGLPAATILAHGKQASPKEPLNQSPVRARAEPVCKPLTKPVGIMNKSGTCYMSVALQAFEAAYAARPEEVGDLINCTDSGLVGAFKKMRCYKHSSTESCTVFPSKDASVIVTVTSLGVDISQEALHDPVLVNEEWRKQNTSVYDNWFVRVRRNDDGSVSNTEELCPERVGVPLGGHSVQVIERLIVELRRAASEHNLPSPFTTIVYPARVDSLIHKVKHALRAKFAKNTSLAPVINPFAAYNIDTPSPFLVFYNKDREQYMPQVDIEIEIKGEPALEGTIPTRKIHQYKLVAIAQHNLVSLNNTFGFNVVGHGVCYARYNDQWFVCSDETVTPVSVATMQAMLKEDARTFFKGRAVASNCPYAFPEMMLYERVAI